VLWTLLALNVAVMVAVPGGTTDDRDSDSELPRRDRDRSGDRGHAGITALHVDRRRHALCSADRGCERSGASLGDGEARRLELGQRGGWDGAKEREDEKAPWFTCQAHLEGVTRLEGDGPVEAGYLLIEVRGASDLGAIQGDGGAAHPIAAVGVAVLDVEAEGGNERGREGDGLLELIGRPGGPGVLLGAEDHLFGGPRRPQRHGRRHGRDRSDQPPSSPACFHWPSQPSAFSAQRPASKRQQAA
jgi:hypothetical protein